MLQPHFQGSLFDCFENALTIDLLFFFIIDVSIDYDWNEVPNLLLEKYILN